MSPDAPLTAPADAPLLRMTDISKTYPGVRALESVSLELRSGEVLAVMGENGAGKSTLMKILAGAVEADSGSIHVSGRKLRLSKPADARASGISVIHQEFNLIPTLSVPENLFLGRELTRHGFLRKREERERAKAVFERMGAEMDLYSPCRHLTAAQQQLAEIARALLEDARILVMDEPSATLTGHEVERLFAIVRDLRRQGLGILYISHRLEEIFALADRVLFLRDGKPAGDSPIRNLTRSGMIERMVGRQLKNEYPPRGAVPDSEIVLEARSLCRGTAVRSVSICLRKGEILALTGLVGSGRTETARLLFGADVPDSGTILRNGKPVRVHSPEDAIRAGIGFLPEDRKHQGLILRHSVLANFELPGLVRFCKKGFVDRSLARGDLEKLGRDLRLKTPGPDAAVGNLSGGNQQKVVLAKWLARDCDVLIFDEPTRGVDVGARFEIYTLMRELVAQGKSILMISSEMPEVLGLADRILVMHDGRITGEICDVPSATQEQVMELAIA
jgi:ABC-type sugar transport system ATPase subunit